MVTNSFINQIFSCNLCFEFVNSMLNNNPVQSCFKA